MKKETFVLRKYHPVWIALIERANNCLEEKQFAEMSVFQAFYTVIMEKRAGFYLKEDNQ